jgi:hypothetical protein
MKEYRNNRKIDEIEFLVFRKTPGPTGPALINSLLKSGTNFLAKVLQLFCGLSKENLHLGYSGMNKFAQELNFKTNLVRIGVDFPTAY